MGGEIESQDGLLLILGLHSESKCLQEEVNVSERTFQFSAFLRQITLRRCINNGPIIVALGHTD